MTIVNITKKGYLLRLFVKEEKGNIKKENQDGEMVTMAKNNRGKFSYENFPRFEKCFLVF